MKRKLLIWLLIFNLIRTLSSAQVLLQPEVDSIPMRDGKMLAADIYLPGSSKDYPAILVQTPYNRLFYRLGLPLIGKDIKTSPYAFVIVDWRCFYGSQKACKILPDRGQDGYDVIDWIAQQSWSNGKVGTWGPSALGKVQYLTAREQHPAHICAVPIVAAPQFTYKEYYPGGVYRPEYVEQLDALGYGMSTYLQAHPYYDTWWKIAEAASWYPEKIKIPMLLIGGWFDHTINEMFEFFDTLGKASDPAARDQHKILVGPWSHSTVGEKQVGDLQFPYAEGISDSFARLFFDYYLLGAKNGWLLNKKYMLSQIYWTGEKYYSSELEKFSEDEFNGMSALVDTIFLSTEPFPVDSYLIIGNPRYPSPTIGGPTLRVDLKQGPAEISSTIKHDSSHFIFNYPAHPSLDDFYLTGKSTLNLLVSTDQPDCDLAARLAVRDPDNDKMYILADGISRSRFRYGFSKIDEKLNTPFQKYWVEIEFPRMNIFFDAHNLVIIISASNYPRYDINLNNGKEMYTAGDTMTAHIYLHFNHNSFFRYNGYQIIEGIKEKAEPEAFVFPNPAGNYLYFKPPGNSNLPSHVIIYDVNGKSLLNSTITTQNIFVGDLKPGVYFARIFQGSRVATGRFVKMEK